uniref:SAM domain-containing protein n=1 Tax=Wuchereria bancrofti TaxID=6293 RepID=A0A1I8EBS8_WUCBA
MEEISREENSKQEIFITEVDEDADDERRLIISDDKHTDSPFSSADEDALDNSPPDSQNVIKNDEKKSIYGVQSPQREITSKSTTDMTFSWQEYLKETEAIAAPEDCFYQDPIPPKNNFTTGKKVEVPDPRGKEVQCLATIVAVHSLWVCLRLDGEDGSNDHWLICDDERIKPVGHCVRNGLILQPPFGFMYNLASFHKFIENQLKPAADGSSPVASPESFKPIPFKYHPRKNTFQVGMKCEAIDRKNFNGRPCPATVVDVKGDYLTISYDGWNKAYDCKERYDSRFIFPVGWAAKSGLEVQPPNYVKGKVLQRMAQKDTVPKAPKEITKTCPNFGITKVLKRKSSNTNKTQNRKRKRISSVRSLPHNSSDGSCSSHLVDIIDQVRASKRLFICHTISGIAKQTHTVEASSASNVSSQQIVTSAADAVAILDNRIEPRARKTVPSPVVPEGPVIRQSRKTVSSPDGVQNILAAPDIVLSTTDVQPEVQKMIVYLNRGCRCAPILNASLVRKLPEKFGPGTVHHILRETIQQIVNCAVDPSFVFKKIDPGTIRILSITAEIHEVTHVRAIPALKTLASAWDYLHAFTSKLNVCRNFLTEEPICCPLCSCQSDDGVVSTTAGGGVLKYGTESDDSEDYEGHQYSDLAEWSMQRVANEVENMFDANIAEKFLQNQIDGKALILLTTELLIRHLEMPFGPALKMMSYIESLKRKAWRTTNHIL